MSLPAEQYPNYETDLYQIRRPELRVVPAERMYVNTSELIDRAAVEMYVQELIENYTPPEKKITQREYEDNARTAIFEAVTSSGHLSRVEFQGNLEEIHQQIVTRLLNGLFKPMPVHEWNRRFAELCEEVTKHTLLMRAAAGELPANIVVNTISDYPEKLGALAEGEGYRPKNRKGMVRGDSLLLGPNGEVAGRFIEQVSRSNGDAEETIEFLEGEQIAVERSQAPDIDVLSTQFLGIEDIVGLVRRLDAKKGPNIMYGEPKRSDTVAYEHLREVSTERERKMEGFIKDLAAFEAKLDRRKASGEITWQQWRELYADEVDEIADLICVLDPSYAAATFGAHVEHAYRKAHEQYIQGDTGGASETIASVADIRDSVNFCGGRGNQPNSPQPSDKQERIERIKQRLDTTKEWPYVNGYCRVTNCPTAGGITEVGPCDVCKGCQKYYDQKLDPAKEYLRKLQNQAFNEALFASKPAAEVKEAINRPTLVVVDNKPEIGGAAQVYRDTRTGAIGTAQELGRAA